MRENVPTEIILDAEPVIWEPPRLEILDTVRTESGSSNVPESNNGLLES